MNTERHPPELIISSGEPAGIGPDLVVELFRSTRDLAHLTILIDPELLQERASMLGVDIGESLIVQTSTAPIANTSGKPAIMPVRLRAPVKAGTLDSANAPYLLEMLDIAIDGCRVHRFDAMVTGPLQKSVINDAGIQFSGHTEYLARGCDDAFPVMLLACPGLRVALVTTHLPLRDVPDAITEERLESVLTIVIDEMQSRFGISHPELVVCGLNPHAGESGHLGTEEQTLIEPVMNKLRHKGARLIGPLPADTAFRPELRESADVFIAMYHDQGLPVLKTLGFGEAVNVTLGLPIIRTSVDHGTALSLAGSGEANCESLLAAIDTAEFLAARSAQADKPRLANG